MIKWKFGTIRPIWALIGAGAAFYYVGSRYGFSKEQYEVSRATRESEIAGRVAMAEGRAQQMEAGEGLVRSLAVLAAI